MKETFGKRLLRLRKRAGHTQKTLADASELSESYISRLESDDFVDPSGPRLGRIAAVLSVTVGELLGETTSEDPSVDDLISRLQAARERERDIKPGYVALGQDIIAVPVAGSLTAAGEGAVASVEYWPYLARAGERDHDFVGVVVKGDCLAPRILDGEQIIIDRSAEPKVGDVVAVQVDGESLLRILAEGELIALNGHPPIPMSERVHVEGVVVFAGGRP